jgi:hypothetical protein
MGAAGSFPVNSDNERMIFRELEKEYARIKMEKGSDKAGLKIINRRLGELFAEVEKGAKIDPDKFRKKEKARRDVMFSESIAVGQSEKFELKEYPKTESEMEILLMSIRKNFLFTTLSNKEKNNLAKAMRCKIIKQGETIINQGT